MAQLTTVCGKQFEIDDEDFAKCYGISWYWSGTIVYNHNIGSLAKFLLNTKQLIDHRNLNPLDFTKDNLRVSNKSLNAANTNLRNTNTSGFKGVYFRTERMKWIAKIMVDGKDIHLGTFTSKQEAADAYDNAATKYFGEFARTNKMIAAGGY